VIRELATGEHVSGLGAALETLLASSVPADRAAGAWGQAARDPARAITLLSHSDRVVVCAAARAALSPEVAPTAAERLAKEKDPVVRTALAIALAREPSARLVPTKLLTELALGGGPAAPIAAKALAARDERATIDLLLGSSDPLVRTHVALGLSDNRDPAVVGLLSRRFKFETDASVRYAMVVALSRRSETSRRVTLREAADLDGDTRVRQAARRALSGSRLPALPRGTGTLWLSLVASQKGGAVSQEAMIGMPSGLSLPVVADPDGAVTLSRLPSGPLSLRLAARATEDKAQGP
jgi:hypothetical protein